MSSRWAVPLSRDIAVKRASEWIEAWNRHDITGIMSHYAPTVRFSSPRIVHRPVVGHPSGSLTGHAALTAYFTEGLRLMPNLHFTLQNVLVGADGYSVIYQNERGTLVCDSVRLDEQQLIAEGRAYYGEQHETTAAIKSSSVTS